MTKRDNREKRETKRDKEGQRETKTKRDNSTKNTDEKANTVRTCYKNEDNTDPKYGVTLQHRGKPNQGKTKKTVDRQCQALPRRKKHQDGGGIGDGEGQKRVETVHPATPSVVC